MLSLGVRAHDFETCKTAAQIGQACKDAGIRAIQLALNKSFSAQPGVAGSRVTEQGFSAAAGSKVSGITGFSEGQGETKAVPRKLATLETINSGMGRYFRDEFRRFDVSVAILGCYSNIIHPSPEVRAGNLRVFEQYLRHVSSFGTHIVGTETGSLHGTSGFDERNFTQEAFDEVLKSTLQLCEAASKHGAIVGIEPGLNHPIYDLNTTEQLIAGVDSAGLGANLGIIFDLTSLLTSENHLQAEGIAQEAFDRFGERIVAAHLKDYVLRPSPAENARALDAEHFAAQNAQTSARASGEPRIAPAQPAAEPRFDPTVRPVPLGEGLLAEAGGANPQPRIARILQIIEAEKPYLDTFFENTTNEKIAPAIALAKSYTTGGN